MTGRKKRWTNATWRVWAVITVLGLGGFAIVARLVQLQILDHARYAEAAREMHINQETIADRRGALLDRNGYPLAASQDAYNLMVETGAWKDPADAMYAANLLSQATGVPSKTMTDIVASVDAYEVPVAKGLTYAQATAVRNLRLTGVRLLDTPVRVYPEGNIASQLMGFIGYDGSGLTGLESDLNTVLGGSSGTLTYERDAAGQELAIGDRSETPAEPGSNVVLTIDRYIQQVAQEELQKAVDAHQASGGSVLVVRPQTGEILAVANYPSFDVTKPDLNDPSKADTYRNRAVTDAYEPGSVFKLITTAAGLDTGTVTPTTPWYDSGEISFGDWTIRNWDLSSHGSMDVQGMLTLSLNTGAAWVAQQCGPDTFYQYVQKFGFGVPTGSGLSGESAGNVRSPDTDPSGWSQVDLATNSFGQGITATPLQMAMALGAIANGGNLMKPMFVKEVDGPSGSQPVAPEVVRQAISPQTSRTLLDMMGVVADNVSRDYLNVPGYTVGAKTGTAQVADGNGGYKATYISSFAGIVPLESPQLAILVKVDEPKDVPWGSAVAAPVFSGISNKVLPYLNIPPSPPKSDGQ
ncbi:MAG: penicillin-binding protein 2 [Chloroflexota bacterium]